MWNLTTNKLFLPLRADAVLLLKKDDLTLTVYNQPAKLLFPQMEQGIRADAIFPDQAFCEALKNTKDQNMQTFVLQSFSEVPYLATIQQALWEDVPSLVISLIPEAETLPAPVQDIVAAALPKECFTAICMDLQSLSLRTLRSPNPLQHPNALFADLNAWISLYGETFIHPEDRMQFLRITSDDMLRRCASGEEIEPCFVRCMQIKSYYHAKYTLSRINSHTVLLSAVRLEEKNDGQRKTSRSNYILSGVSDIFRMMLHIDLKTGDTVFCSMPPEFQTLFFYDTVYSSQDVTKQLLSLVHPDDRERVASVMSLDQYCVPSPEPVTRIAVEYRRIAPHGDPDATAKWTRSVLTFPHAENAAPVEAIFSVQDIDAQRRREIASKSAQDFLAEQFYTLIRNRFLMFISCDFGEKTVQCSRIVNRTIEPPEQIPFGQFFEKLIMPNCHPEDYMRVAKALLPQSAEELFRSGKRAMAIVYRHKADNIWKYARAELYLQTDDLNTLHAMIYISDIHEEYQNRQMTMKAEREQLMLRRKFGLMVQDAFVQIAEIDLDADVYFHYHVSDNDFVRSKARKPFSQASAEFPERYIHPDHRAQFCKLFSYDAILKAARENVAQIKQLFLFDIKENGEYSWCNVCARFFHDENGKSYVMSYVENVNEEIQERDAQLHEVLAVKERLQVQIRKKEQTRIRKAHLFLNIASNFQLRLNEIYATLDKLEHTLPPMESIRSSFRSLFASYETLSAMTEIAKDMMLLENNQLPLLREPVNLPRLFRQMREQTDAIITEKDLKITSYTKSVEAETILCDSSRLSFVFDNLLTNILRSLPEHSKITLSLQQSPDPTDAQRVLCEFSLITYGDSVSQDIQSSICLPIPPSDPLKGVDEIPLLRNVDSSQYNLYFSKRLITLMNGSLEYIPLPENASAIVLRLPFPFLPNRVIFPHRFCFGKEAIVWESQKNSATAAIGMLKETGLNVRWSASFDNLLAELQYMRATETPCEILMVRQSALNAEAQSCMAELEKHCPQAAILILADAPPAPHTHPLPQQDVHLVRTPLFRSVLANHLWQIARAREEKS